MQLLGATDLRELITSSCRISSTTLPETLTGKICVHGAGCWGDSNHCQGSSHLPCGTKALICRENSNKNQHLRALVEPMAAVRRERIFLKLYGSGARIALALEGQAPLREPPAETQAHNACRRLRPSQNVRERPPSPDRSNRQQERNSSL